MPRVLRPSFSMRTRHGRSLTTSRRCCRRSATAGLFAVGYGLGQRAAAVAAMLVTAAAFPLAVKSMEQSGSKVAMRQLANNSALLIALLAPSIAGIFMLRA